jgi:small conductance mechanosensitive channel
MDAISKLDGADAFTDSVVDATAEHLRFQADLYDRIVENLLGSLSEMRAERPDLSASDLTDLETRIASERKLIDQCLSRFMDIAHRMEALSLDTTEEWSVFDAFIQERAESLASRLQVAVEERARTRKQLKDAQQSGATNDQLAELRAQLLAKEPRIQGISASLNKTSSFLDHRGLPSTEYRQIIIRATGEVTEDLLDPKVLLGLAVDYAVAIWGWLKERGPVYLTRLLILVLFAILFNVVSRILWWLAQLTKRTGESKLLRDLVGRMLRPFSTIVGLIMGLWFLGVDATALITGVGVAGVIVGLALQDSLANLAAGAFIIAYRPYDVDDSVQVGGYLGKVKAMGLANTVIHTFDNRRLSVPNRKIWEEVIENRSSQHLRRVERSIQIRFQDDIDEAFRVIRKMLDEHEMVVAMPEPSIYVKELGDSGIEIAVWPWTNVENWWTLTMELPRDLWYCLKDAGIQVPYPRREIDMISPGPDSAPRRGRPEHEGSA